MHPRVNRGYEMIQYIPHIERAEPTFDFNYMNEIWFFRNTDALSDTGRFGLGLVGFLDVISSETSVPKIYKTIPKSRSRPPHACFDRSVLSS